MNPKKENKRILDRAISVLLTACIMMSTFSVPISAYAEMADSASSSDISSSRTDVDSGNAVEVTESDVNSNSNTSSSESSSSDSESSSEESSSSDETSSDSSDSSDNSNSDSSSSSNSDEQNNSSDSKEDNSNSDESSDSENTDSEEENKQDDFVAVGIVAPESDVITAAVGDEVTLTSKLNRDDVEVSYQWQRIQKEPIGITSSNAIYDYSEGEPTRYSFVLDDTTESEYIAKFPDSTWRGIEMYYAVVEALDAIGEDSSNVSIEWNTENYVLNGYTISAARVGDHVEVYAEKDGERHVGTLNSEGKWSFGDAQEATLNADWQDIEGATSNTYTFTVGYDDFSFLYRCVVTVLDEEYKEACKAILEGQGVILTEEQLAAEQKLYSLSYTVKNSQITEEARIATFATNDSVAVGNPKLSDDVQWITGLTGSYEYITKDTYDRITAWLNEATGAERKRRQELADLCWTYLHPKGSSAGYLANIFDENGLPTGETREYIGFNLTDGMLEVNSNWYGKTVYFRPDVDGADNWSNIGTAIEIPAYTELSKNADGGYVEAASGTRYKKAITLLNPYMIDVGSKYKDYLELGVISTSSFYPKGKGWLLDDNGNVTDNHVTVYTVNCEKFNADPEKYMVDAEGNYRMDSVAWGVCAYEEPDISGKSYWILKDYIANGYGFLIGHDTIYGYAGAYYDAFGKDLDESAISRDDGTTWYYDINSWIPGTTGSTYEWDSQGHIVASTGHSETRGGHFYLNKLIGSNAGNVYSGNVKPSDAPSNILSGGGSHGIYGKNLMYGGNSVKVIQTGYSADKAITNPRFRTPTNYPFAFNDGQVFSTSETHTNQQITFATIWANYAENTIADKYGFDKDERLFTIGNSTGTNNFYLTGTGNFLMNQIGHLPWNSATTGEAKLFANSAFYVSQRKQCEICAANQDGHQTVHFVHRVSSANAEQILSILRNGGNYWYSLDDCYMLIDDITLPEDWTPIKNFSGHWNSDVYTVTLNSSGTPLIDNTETPAKKYNTGSKSGWNLGADQAKGVENVFKTDDSGIRTTGVARVVGDLSDLFNANTNYAGYTVKILGSDNPNYLPAGEEYSCTVNTDSKYVISNLPCIYDTDSQSGILRARVYKPDGTEVTEYGVIRTNVDKNFWNNDMTTPLYLGSFTVSPVEDEVSYEKAQAFFKASTISSEVPSLVGWQYRESATSEWKEVPEDWNIKIENENSELSEGDKVLKSTLTLNNVNPKWNGYEFRAVFTSENYGQWNTSDYYLTGAVANGTSGTKHIVIAEDGSSGQLKVNLWAGYAEQGDNVTVYEGDKATFTSTGYALDDGAPITAEWQYRADENGDWHNVAGSEEFGGLEVIETSAPTEEMKNEVLGELTKVSPETDKNVFADNATFHSVTTKLTVDKVDIKQDKMRFRVHYTATSSFGTKIEWYSDIANDKSGVWDTDAIDYTVTKIDNHSNILYVNAPELSVNMQEASLYPDSNANIDINDKIGQSLVLPTVEATVANGTAVYRAKVYYLPEQIKPNVAWQYRTYKDTTAKDWTNATPGALGYSNVTVSITNADKGTTVIDGVTYNVIESTMTIGNVPLAMYNMENYLKYFFRCIATSTYDTVKETGKSITKVDTRDGYQWGGLSLDYNITVNHNGVLGYGGQNNIANAQNASYIPTHTLEEVVNATKSSDRVYWKYPNLQIKAPSGQHINTVIVWFDDSYRHSSNDYIGYDNSMANQYGISLSESTNQKIVFVSRNANTVELAQWNEFLRNYVWFVTYDRIDYTDLANTNSSISGGARIKWHADELRMTGVKIDTATNKAYKVVTKSDIINWDDAKREARGYNADLGTNGYLAEINSADENNLIHNLLGNNIAWIGGTRTSGSWKWSQSNSNIGYSNWDGSANQNNNYLTMNGSGRWNSYNASSSINKQITVINLANSGNGNAGVMWGTHTIPFYVTAGHKYYISARGGDYGDANGQCAIHCDALGAYAKNNECADYNNWMTRLYGIYTANSSTNTNLVFDDFGYGSNISGNYVWRFGANIYDLTAAFGAGNEPNLSWCETNLSGLGDWGNVTFKGNVTVNYNIQNITDVRAYVVEYDLSNLGMGITNHSAEDTDYIGLNAAYNPPQGDKSVSVVISGKTKIYDKTDIYPDAFIVVGGSGASKDLFEITYTLKSGDYADYAPTTVNGADYQNSGAVNAGEYRASVKLTDAAVAAGWVLDTTGSVTECDLYIKSRPVDVYSHNNNKVYDGTADGTISNLATETITADRGVVAGDVVNFNTTSLSGYYTSNSLKTIHNSTTNSDTGKWVMERDEKVSPLYIIHDDTSDPHHNYYIGNEDYSGSITSRPLYVHSLYQDTDTENNPRNVKYYDGTNAATVRNIIVDNIVAGDTVKLDKTSYSGAYADKNAGETLTAEGSTQKDRLNKLVENEITLTEQVSLTNNDYGDYYIASEKYSGAIARTSIVAKVRSWRGTYGTGMAERPWHDTVSYKDGKTPTIGCWLSISGLTGGDELTLDYAKSNFKVKDVADGNMQVTETTPVGTYGLTYEGLNETNYDVLKNYVVSILDGSLKVEPREIVVQVNDAQKMTGDENPTFNSTFFVRDNDDNLIEVGSDDTSEYADMGLTIGTDTIGNSVLVRPHGEENTVVLSKTDGVSNISYVTDCEKDSPAQYLNLTDLANQPIERCEWCENYHGFALGTDHWKIAGYEVKVNQNPETGSTLEVAYVTNPLGEQVQNYTLSYVSGTLFVHPELRFQLKATVPMTVCMYGYRGDGQVVEPTNYGITNYSNGSIEVTDIDVSNDGWILSDSTSNLKAGEMYVKMNDTVLKLGHNTPHAISNWVATKGNADTGEGTFLKLPLTCYIAGGNVNDANESYVMNVTYTIAEHGKTLPGINN